VITDVRDTDFGKFQLIFDSTCARRITTDTAQSDGWRGHAH